ncbi:uncharacterized alpha-1,2-galactosyltransferase C637.06 [Selaginella moellendorffii]|uniref:uncharacterized alpha-1,2-galactosyltransferase C637.06 n=1 Tax=Selaginella moellendorffii TaxID=88036 RepID=UPI000D1C5B32|nr:uncharacterized alpha-1,2-galactosyltransferase C637.06 [Selaginella moellendorffii]|eukprot:XP_002964665.2 uncharacterized alpha-1,2-galactosyltransferase C637.06 [Selaginella moellendorffii]
MGNRSLRRRHEDSLAPLAPLKSDSDKRSVSRMIRRRRGPRLLVTALALLFAIAGTAIAASLCARFLLLNANRLGRQCSSGIGPRQELSFGIVSCSDDLSTVPHRSFHGMMQLVSPNKQRYAAMHGYGFIDASDVLDAERPPSWSKIKAVRKHLGSYDWIFWNDADSLVTNFAVTLEEVVSSTLGDVKYEDRPDLIITQDVTGFNAGMFFIRDSAWSRDFLTRWWNQTSHIKPFGESKSGDNDALKFLIQSMPAEERQKHIHVPRMQCLFNSYLWMPTWRNVYRLLVMTRMVWKGKSRSGQQEEVDS